MSVEYVNMEQLKQMNIDPAKVKELLREANYSVYVSVVLAAMLESGSRSPENGCGSLSS